MRRTLGIVAAVGMALLLVELAWGWVPLPVKSDPLVRMPGSQQGEGVTLEAPNRCLNCHEGYNPSVEPGFNWKGSMMAQAARDFLFWACLTVAGQDSVWAAGTPNAVDICERCHFPGGWLGGRSDPPNASAMTGADFDGVQCDFCHTMVDPFFASTHAGAREGSDWRLYWDETNASATPSQAAADATLAEDINQSQALTLFNGTPMFAASHTPAQVGWTENGSGQFFVSAGGEKRASFADAAARHQMLYSRYHKSKFFCQTCHDVSNPVLANLGAVGTVPGDGATILPTESQPASSYFHVERTFSEFMLSAYGAPGGAPGKGAFAPAVFDTSDPDDHIRMCQDCHMRDVRGAGCNKNGVPVRPVESVEHPFSGQPLHDLTGGNMFVPWVLASSVTGSSNYDPVNAGLLGQGPQALTLDLTQGVGLDAAALLAGVDRARQQLELAAEIQNVQYDPATGHTSFRIQNNTGHKLISGFPEGRRMFVNVQLITAGSLSYEVNPYDGTVGTLKGLDSAYSSSSPPLGQAEVHTDELVYEMHPSSSLTGESSTFHFALADGRSKDNRIPPKGFDIAAAAQRLSEPVVHGQSAPGLYTAAEYAGGYDDVALDLPTGADGVRVTLYYQTTSREYIEFLRDEINGNASTLSLGADGRNPAGGTETYVVQSDSFFAGLRAWGDTIWQLWDYNKNVPGAAPFAMASATWGNVEAGCTAPVPTLLAATPGQGEVSLSWSDEHAADGEVVGYRVYYDQGGKTQPVTEVGLTTTWTDTGLTNGQQYCYAVTSLTACESATSNLLCATPEAGATTSVRVDSLTPGRLVTVGRGKNQETTFTPDTLFTVGDTVALRAVVVDAATGLPVEGVTVELLVTGPQVVALTSAASGADGVAYAEWRTEAPRRGKGGTTPGSYVAAVTDTLGAGFSWDGTPASAGFSIQ